MNFELPPFLARFSQLESFQSTVHHPNVLSRSDLVNFFALLPSKATNEAQQTDDPRLIPIDRER